MKEKRGRKRDFVRLYQEDFMLGFTVVIGSEHCHSFFGVWRKYQDDYQMGPWNLPNLLIVWDCGIASVQVRHWPFLEDDPHRRKVSKAQWGRLLTALGRLETKEQFPPKESLAWLASERSSGCSKTRGIGTRLKVLPFRGYFSWSQYGQASCRGARNHEIGSGDIAQWRLLCKKPWDLAY